MGNHNSYGNNRLHWFSEQLAAKHWLQLAKNFLHSNFNGNFAALLISKLQLNVIGKIFAKWWQSCWRNRSRKRRPWPGGRHSFKSAKNFLIQFANRHSQKRSKLMCSYQGIISSKSRLSHFCNFLNFTTSFIINWNKVSPFDTARDDDASRKFILGMRAIGFGVC